MVMVLALTARAAMEVLPFGGSENCGKGGEDLE